MSRDKSRKCEIMVLEYLWPLGWRWNCSDYFNMPVHHSDIGWFFKTTNKVFVPKLWGCHVNQFLPFSSIKSMGQPNSFSQLVWSWILREKVGWPMKPCNAILVHALGQYDTSPIFPLHLSLSTPFIVFDCREKLIEIFML